jgi:MoaA/NifB/PqqE/SkfB family radical SAM enzyme
MRFNNYKCYLRMLVSGGFLRSLWNARGNLAACAKNNPPPAGPYMVELDVTYRCDLHCRMCERWKDPRQGELSLEEYRRLALELRELGVHQISIAGGEPLLRPDVFAIIESFARRGMSVNLCTNGMQLGRYADEIAASGATCVTVSLDGATAACHDAVRGRAGSHARVIANIDSFLARRRRRLPLLRVRMTVSNTNAGEIRQFYRQWRHVADDVLLQPVHHCRDAHYHGADETAFDLDPAVIADQLRGTPMARDRYMQQLVAGLTQTGSFPAVPCFAGVLMARIDPWGNIYPCLEQHVRIGSLREKGFRAVWNSAAFEAERRRLASNRPCRCWYNNTAMIGHYGALLNRTTPGRLIEKLPGRLADRFKSLFSGLVDERRYELGEVVDDADVRFAEDRRGGVGVEGHDEA